MAAAPHHPAIEEIRLDAVLRALGEPLRLAIADELAEHGEQTCSALAAKLDVPLSTLSGHLRVLRESGVTASRRERTKRWTSLRRDALDARYPGLLEAVLQGAKQPAHS